ncbi:uncharacterized protein LOC143281148 [Babylonia areolata]|uniref:uncharacterized protein LOC143281148 n=1 Tax=Babylonia areolata TaxID=304850 RepID=UPI003FD1A86C
MKIEVCLGQFVLLLLSWHHQPVSALNSHRQTFCRYLAHRHRYLCYGYDHAGYYCDWLVKRMARLQCNRTNPAAAHMEMLWKRHAPMASSAVAWTVKVTADSNVAPCWAPWKGTGRMDRDLEKLTTCAASLIDTTDRTPQCWLTAASPFIQRVPLKPTTSDAGSIPPKKWRRKLTVCQQCERLALLPGHGHCLTPAALTSDC